MSDKKCHLYYNNVTYGKRAALNITEQAVLAILKQNPAISREEIAERVSKTVRTVQRALGSLTEKGYIKRVGAKKNSTWEVLK
ncbi:MAG: winged helix-turn-helix domain-containing protein [Lachnospiraceae bacterium]|nr:winged helix-turn-helix domain-containing protein [Lachnospiraceae bacterium]